MHGRNLTLELKNKMYLGSLYRRSQQYGIVFFLLAEYNTQRKLAGARAQQQAEHLEDAGRL